MENKFNFDKQIEQMAVTATEQFMKRTEPILHRKVVYRMRYGFREFREQWGYQHIRYNNEIPPGLVRQCMINFAQTQDIRIKWIIENGIAISVDAYVDPACFEYCADFIAHMTLSQVDAWEKFEMINKLAGV